MTERTDNPPDTRQQALRRAIGMHRRLLLLALASLVAAAVVMHLNSELARQSRLQVETVGAADRFIELAVRARLVLTLDPAAAHNASMIADGLFDNRAVHASWEEPVEIRWTLLAGDPTLMVLELSGLPEAACPWFAGRLLQRAPEAAAQAVRINDAVVPIARRGAEATAPSPRETLVCNESNTVAVLIEIPGERLRAPTGPALRFA